MTIHLPRLRVLAACGVAACASAAALVRYFGASIGGSAALAACWLLFAAALALRPSRRETLWASLPAALFAGMRTLGRSYDELNSYGMILKNARTLMAGLGAMAALFAAALCAVLLTFALLRAASAWATAGKPEDKRGRRRLFWLCAALTFAGAIPYLMLYAPGLNIFDTHDQILQFFGYPSYIGDGSALSDHHPVLLTVIYGGFMKLGLRMGDANIGQLIYSLTSMAALALCWAHALCTLRDAGLRRGAVIALAAGIAVYPVFGLYAFNMCKDVSVEPFVLLYAAQMIRLHQTDGQIARDNRFCASLALCSLLMMLMRKPAFYALCFAAIFLILRFRGVRLRLAAATLSAAVIFSVGYNALLLPALGVIPGETREMLSVPFQQTARYLITYPDDVTQEEMDAVSRILDVEHATAHYDPRLADPVKDTTNPDFTGEEMRAYVRAWLSMGLRHPGVYVDAWLNMIYGYFYPSDSNTIVCLTLNSPNRGGVNLTQDASLEGARQGLFNWVYYAMRRTPGLSALFYVDTVTWAFLLLLVAMVLKDGIAAAAPWMFFAGTLGICMLSPKNGEIRYLMPILYALPVMLGAALLPARGGKVKEAHHD